MARNDMRQVLDEEIDDKSSSYVFKNAYEVIRTAATAHMAKKGYNPYFHTVVVAYLKDSLSFAEHKVSKFNKFRKLRNNIQYRAEKATTKEAREIVEMMQETVPKIERKL